MSESNTEAAQTSGNRFNNIPFDRNVNKPFSSPTDMTRYVECNVCHKTVPHYAKGMCHKCYRRQHVNKCTKCIVCGEIKPHVAKGMCRKCYNTHYTHITERCKPMSENRSCSHFLGVHVAERVLHKHFKNATRMPTGHRGYDFVCGMGLKIDVKSACVRKNRWDFHTNRNIEADYFLCMAFDNRDDLNLLHAWYIPNSCIDPEHKSITISKSTVDKWDTYRLDITGIVECCDAMKGGAA